MPLFRFFVNIKGNDFFPTIENITQKNIYACVYISLITTDNMQHSLKIKTKMKEKSYRLVTHVGHICGSYK